MKSPEISKPKIKNYFLTVQLIGYFTATILYMKIIITVKRYEITAPKIGAYTKACKGLTIPYVAT